MVEAADEVRNAIGAVRYKLPVEMREPILHAHRPGRAADHAAGAVVRPRRRHAEISRLAEDELADRFRGIDGVADRQRQRRAAPRAVGAAARREAARIQRLGRPRWSTRCARRTPPRRSARCAARWTSRASAWSGRIESPSEFEQIVVKRRGDEIVRLGQVAKIEDGFAELATLRCATATRTSACRVTARATPAPWRWPTRCASGRRHQQELPDGHEADDHARRRQGRAEQPEQRDRTR